MKPKGVLIISPWFSPNVGGVETHLDDLVKELARSGYKVYVQAYSPITTPGVKWEPREEYNNVQIRRYRWFGKTLLHKIEKIPVLDFLYITPYLLARVLWFMILHHDKIDIIHAHGFNAALIGKILKAIFGKRLVVGVHSIYEVDPDSGTACRIRDILLAADRVATLSDASRKELVSFGITENKVTRYKYWIDIERFKPLDNKSDIRRQLDLPDNFTVLCVARLTVIKGIKEFIEVAKKLPKITFVLIGNGPLEGYAKEAAEAVSNFIFLGGVDNKKMHPYYNIGDVFCIPSQYEEGFGRVAMEAVACGSPVVGSNKGGIPEALDDTVSMLVEPTVDNLERAILRLFNDRDYYKQLKNNCREYAERNFGRENAGMIFKCYEEL